MPNDSHTHTYICCCCTMAREVSNSGRSHTLYCASIEVDNRWEDGSLKREKAPNSAGLTTTFPARSF